MRALVEVSADGLALLDVEGRFVMVNEAATQLLGLPAAELIGRPAPFVPTAEWNGPSARHTDTWSAPDGRRCVLEYRISPTDAGGYAVWFSDVTGARRQQERLAAITRAASSVADSYSLRATLDAVAHEIVLTTNIAAVQILAVDDPADELRVLGMAGFGNAPDFIQRLSACRRRGATVLFMEAIRTRRPVVVRHRKPVIMADSRWGPLHEIMDRPDWDDFVSLPMIVRGRTVGVINTYYVPGEDPCSSSLAFLEAMADHAAVAIDTASLLSQTRSRAQEQERRRLARELHDSAVQQLFSMRMQAKALRAELDRAGADPAAVCNAAEEIAQLSESALADLRRLVFELRPLDLGARSLVDAVRAHAASVGTRTGMAVRVRVSPDLDPDPGLDLQEDVYCIVREALHNVVKHARATSVDIRLARAHEGGLVVEISDDGCGLDVAPGAAAAPRDTLGLVSMRERAERWGGRLAAGPRQAGGWTVTLTLPLAS
ncbi:PAS domain S-box-containing protein [Nonomuraea jiangxiensis]|uniref:PAS domain S-box-containing protein n=1 Tax=Nonomuraea jiangxiensis TaxID=633440 RepID=A0A1G8A6N1_9ACTN|nr:PAS domain S-box-containing protein [Nonomuraea jiangxiensis]